MNKNEAITATLLFLPIISSVIALVFRSRIIIRSVSVLASLLILILIIPNAFNQGITVVKWNWFSIGASTIDLIFEFNTKTIPLALMVSFISLLVNVYSIGFFKWDRNQPRYFATLSLFTFGMLGLTLSGNLLQTFVFWELVGITSYLLIGFYRTKPEAAAGSTKALMMNKVGDAGFIIALMVLYSQTGSLEISLLEFLTIPPVYSWLIGIGITLAALSKSAQFPFHTWLPNAMEGPTPISALIHSATMVAAGVFIIIRVSFLFNFELLQFISVAGVLTAIIGGVNALRENEIKRILAWSTVSQLGLMIMVTGLNGFQSSYIHLLSHALFKAGLFLTAGILISSSATSNISDLKSSQKNILLIVSTIILSFSLMGLPLTVGFLSKEYLLSSISSNIYVALFFLINMVSILYSARILSIIYPFKRLSHLSKESLLLIIPVVILSIFSLWITYTPNPYSVSWINKIWDINPPSTFIATIGTLWGLLWFMIALYLIRTEKINSLVSGIPAISTDYFIQASIVKPLLMASQVTNRIDNRIIDRGIRGFVYANFSIALLVRWFDKSFVDGMVRFFAWSAKTIGSILRRFVGGKIQDYIWWTLVALTILFIISRY